MGQKSISRRPREWLPYLGGALLVCLLIVVLTGINIWQESRRYQERAEVLTQNTTKLLAQHIGDVFANADSLLKIVAFQYIDQRSRGQFEPGRFHAYLNQVMAVSPVFLNIRMLDDKGVLRHGSGDGIVPIDLSDRDYFYRLRDLPAGSADSPMIFSGPIFARLAKQWVLVLARRIENPDGSFAGVVFINLHNEVFGDLFASIKLGPTGAIVLRTSEMAQIDRFRRGPKPDADVGNRKVSQKLAELVKIAPDGGSYKAMTNYDQVTRYYSYLKVGPYPFYIIVGEATQDFIASLGVNIYMLLGFGVLMILLAAAGFWHIYRLTQQRILERIDQQAGRIIDASPLAMLVIDPENVVRKANQAASAMFGYPVQELTGMPRQQLEASHSLTASTDPAPQSAWQAGPQALQEQFEVVGLRRDGSEIPLHVALSSIHLDQASHAIVVLDDLTERRKTEAKLHELLSLQTAILDHHSYAIIATDPEGMITLFNPAAEHMLGYRADELVGLHTPMIFHDPEAQKSLLKDDGPSDFKSLVAEINAGGSQVGEMVIRRKDGTHFIASCSASALLDEQGRVTGFLYVVADITELKQAQDRLAHLAHYDPLTNLPNRILFFERLELGLALARRNQSQLALLFLDLDKFKPVNDTWGHAMGDLVLKAVALRIIACLRESDSVGRVGGDEFVVLLMNLQTPDAAVLVAEKIRESLNQPFLLEGKTLSIGSCIGIAIYPGHGSTATELAKNADAAMYRAKDTGRDRVVVFDPEMALAPG
ncbi:diguanylate cyclase domain-containing protein [Lacisediminimonas profundi]|uniref:diguanylate cyclase domain-containing protein n=1 Tax=Lacisediminimonas profundi TaxID=2603856 RepID=UPI001386A23C|nr:diguanylate cyclase [Lacisediminimonas profundi]